MEFSVLLIFVVVYASSLWIFRKICDRKQKPKPPGPWGFPLIGHLPLLGTNPPETFKKWQEKYGDIFRIRMGSWDTIVINGYPAVKEALEKQGDNFSCRPDFLTRKLLMTYRNEGEDSLAFGKFTPALVYHRKIVSRALRVFTKTNVDITQVIIQEEADKMIEEFLSWNRKPNYIKGCVLTSSGSIIYQIVYGRGRNIREDGTFKAFIENNDAFTEFNKSGNAVNEMPWLRFIMPWKLNRFKELIIQEEGLRQKIVREHTIQRTKGENDSTCLTDIFLDTVLPEEVNDKTTSINQKRLMKSLNEIIGAGFETSSTLLSWLILYMIAYPDIQRRVQQEIDAIVGCNRRVDIAGRTRLNFTMATILEVMRIASVNSFALPHSNTKTTEINGFMIDKDSVALINIHSVHNEERFWKDPGVFRPGRLLSKDNKISKEMTSHIIPFSMGRRKCIGEQLAKMELFLLFSCLMQRCSFSKPEGDMLDLRPIRDLVNHPKPFRAIVKERLE